MGHEPRVSGLRRPWKPPATRYRPGERKTFREVNMPETIMTLGPNPSGLCMCGCGETTGIARDTIAERQTVKGTHTRFKKHHHKRLAVAERFWSKVRIAAETELDGCWEWQGGRTRGGYGCFYVDGKRWLAHRWSYRRYVEEFALDKDIMHTCDNPPCVRPSHLRLGDAAANMKDASEKGRMCRGEQSPRAQLTEGNVREMRRLHASGVSQKDIAVIFDHPGPAVCNIVNRKTWKHVECANEGGSDE